MDEQERKRVSRRKFLGDSSKTALAGTAAAFLGFGMAPTRTQAAVLGCLFSCSGTCSGTCSGGCVSGCSGGCSGGCDGGCTGGCQGCSGGCEGGCEGGCTGGCSGGCTGGCSATNRASHADAATGYGTPVPAEEVSNRHLVA
jgi:modification target Cys-rich repeat protein